jgi:poly-gamma-glutamate synthesis protein (capsule biosynthesis protein)
MPHNVSMRTVGYLAALVLLLAGAGCDDAGKAPRAEPTPTSSRAVDPSPDGPSSPAPPPPRPEGPVTIAFAGDLHFTGVLSSRLDPGADAVGPLGDALSRADLAIVNLETAVTTRGAPEPKDYTFRAPPRAFTALRSAGVDVVTMANNHGLDYGPVSVGDALTAARDAGMPVIGLGRDAEQAYRPWIATVKGRRIGFLGATAVMDTALVQSWSAGPDHPGVATALDGDNAALVAAVRRLRPRVDTVVVDLHYGSDLMSCPTEIQRGLARDLVRAGADIVVGQHAHVLVGAGYLGSAYVDYGMGNFQFYSAAGATAETGVLVLTTRGRKISRPRWLPGVVVGGLPTPLRGAAAQEATARWRSLRGCTGLSEHPTP